MTLMILLPLLLVYAVGWPVAYRRQWVRNETERRRGNLVVGRNHSRLGPCWLRVDAGHGQGCDCQRRLFINTTGQFHPTWMAMLWPAAVAVTVARTFWSLSHVGLGLRRTAIGVGAWLHPEVKIADPDKLKTLDEEMFGR